MNESKPIEAAPQGGSCAPAHCSAVRHRGYYVCLEECGQLFGNTYLRKTTDWNDESALTSYRDNATHWPTAQEAQAAYEAWMMESSTRLAETHRQNDQAQRPPPETPGWLQQSRTNYLNRPTAQRGGGSLQRSG
jgi:hypothetical protein